MPSWEELERTVVDSFDGQVPPTDYWGVAISRQHVAEYCSVHRHRFQYLTAVTQRLAPSPARVLEVGTAYGVTLLALRSLGYQVAGADMAEGIESYGTPLIRESVPLQPWDLHTQDWPAESDRYDVVIASEVLEHLQISLNRAVARLAAALNPNGWLIITTPNLYRLESIVRIVRDRNINEAFPDGAATRAGIVVDERCHPREPTLTELCEAFHASSLTGVRGTYFDSFPHPARDRFLCRWMPRLRDTCLVMGRKPPGA